MAEFVQTSTFGEEEIPLLFSENWTSDPDETDLKVKAMQESVEGQPLLLTKPLPPGKECLTAQRTGWMPMKYVISWRRGFN